MSELIDTLLEKARAAQKVVEFWTQEQVDEMMPLSGLGIL